jgi:hypothetical protein
MLASVCVRLTDGKPTRSHEVRKSVTAVFCDVTGCMALGELLDPDFAYVDIRRSCASVTQ